MMDLRPDVYNARCPTRQVLDRVASKWTTLIVCTLARRPHRFGELRRQIDGISQKMLTQRLRELEQDGLVTRRVEPTVPVTVAYALTPLGRTLIAPLAMIRDWSEDHIAEILAARERRNGEEATMQGAAERPIAVQLYTVRDPARDDFAGTLRQLAEGGVRAVELAGYGGLSAEGLGTLLRDLDLRVAGAHIPVAVWDAGPAEVLAELAGFGGEYAVVPFVAPERRGSRAAARALAADLSQWGKAAHAAGVQFAYHHHAFEFDPLPDGDGATLLDVLVMESDPAVVQFEIDVYWAAHAGVDPARLLGELAGRVPLVHLKDMATGPDRADAPAGTGILRWDEILPAATAAGARWWIVEQDYPADPIADALLAHRNMESARREP